MPIRRELTLAEKPTCGRAGSRHCLSTRRCTGGTLQRAWLADGGLRATSVACDPAGDPPAGMGANGVISLLAAVGGADRMRLVAMLTGVHAGEIKTIDLKGPGGHASLAQGVLGQLELTPYRPACMGQAKGMHAHMLLLARSLCYQTYSGVGRPAAATNRPAAATSPAAVMAQSPAGVAEPPARSAVPAIPFAPEKRGTSPSSPISIICSIRCTNPPPQAWSRPAASDLRECLDCACSVCM